MIFLDIDEDFDLEFYKKNNPDLNFMTDDELTYHYINYGKKENRFGSEKQLKDFVEDPNFDIDYYKKYNPDLLGLTYYQLVHHYKYYGKNENRFGSEKQLKDFVEDPNFDIEIYREFNDLNNFSYHQLVHHYKYYGKKEGRMKNKIKELVEDPYFDIDFYRKYNSELKNMTVKELILHYKSYGKNSLYFGSEKQMRDFVGDPYFEIEFLKKYNPDLNYLSTKELVLYYRNYGKKEKRYGSEKEVRYFIEDDNFDIEFYKKENPDLCNMKLNELIHHYKTYGKKEGRFGSQKQINEFIDDDNFDIEFYKKENPDLCNMKLNKLIHHYKTYGKKEGRFGSQKQIKILAENDNFDIEIYKKFNPELKYMSSGSLVNHYRNYGKKEGRICSEKEIKEIVGNDNFDIEIYKNNNPHLHNISYIEILHDYIYSGQMKYYLDNKISFYENDITNSLFTENIKKIKKTSLDIKNIDIIDSFILIIDFPELGGGTTEFLKNIINKYKYYQTFIIIRNSKNDIGVQIIVNNEQILEDNNQSYLKENICLDFLNCYKDKISKIFINHTQFHTNNFIEFLTTLNKEITYITHDYFLLFENPQPLPGEVIQKKKLKSKLLLNYCDTIITQNIGNLNIFKQYINNKKIIVTELPDYRYSLHKHNIIPDNKIIIGVIGYIKQIKGEDIINELYNLIKLNNFNMEIVVFGYINNPNIKNTYYNSINELNELLIEYKPNIIIETSIWQETYSYTLTLSMLTKLPILSYYKSYKYVVNNRLKNYDKSYFFCNIDECVSLINTHKQYFFHTIEPTIFYNSFWDKYFINDNESIKNINYFNEITSNIDHNINTKIHKIIEPYAIYFPQFHRIAENDKLFYQGYTDMENLLKVKYDKKLKSNILTPLKGVINNYDILLNKDLINSQIKLANKFGIKGFAFYHYWFDYNLFYKDNNNIMENFTKQIIDIENDNFSYFFIWPNDKWCNNLYNDYNSDEVLIEKHFNNLIKYFNDKKYKKIDNKPVFAILHFFIWTTENFNKYINYFNMKCIENGFNGIYISCMTQHNLSLFNNSDAYYLNVPSWKNASIFGNVYNKDNTSYVDYNNYVDNFEEEILDKVPKNKDVILNIFPNFDNFVRNYFKKTMTNYSYNNCSLENFDKYLKKLLKLTKKYKNDSKIFLINSWNEWGENMAIEPSNEFKYAYLEIIYNNLKEFINN